jgi:hypothetical protein
LVFLSFAAILLAAGVFAQENGRLPVKRVVLFKNGVGYFEHVGSVRGNESVTVSFTSGQLNDVLKSLTVIDLNGGRIAGVAYGTSAPLDRQIGDLHLPFGDKTSLADFLGALRGTRLAIKSGSTEITGRLLSIERKTRISGGTTLEVDYVSLISDTGELRTTELSPAFSVRLLEPGLPGKVDRFLDLVSAGREADVRQMVISTEGSGERSLYVSYISEVPVWKSTYRIVLNAKKASDALLQGWAIVDNTVGEDWTNVELSLVAGAPQSFIQNLSQPYYTQRPVVPLPENMSVSPQTHESTLIPGAAMLSGVVSDPSGAVVAGATVKAFDAAGNLAAQTTSDGQGAYEIGSLPNGPVRLEIEAPGFNRAVIRGISVTGAPIRQDARLQLGAAGQTVEVAASAPTTETESAEKSVVAGSRNVGSGRTLGTGAALGSRGKGSGAGFGPGSGGGYGGGIYNIDAIRAQAQAAALSQALGDLFEYKLKDPITIPKNRSALVPIAQASITAEKVSVWNEQLGLPRPERALWLTNSTGLTLDGGSVSVLEDETFAGEGVIDPLRPGEKRLVSYAIDLAVNAGAHLGTEAQRVSRVRVSHGAMIQESEIREKKTYTFRNEDSTPRAIIVEHPVRQGYELRGAAKPVETTASWMRFRLDVAPKETASLVVEEARPTRSTFLLSEVTTDQVGLFVSQKSIDPSIEAALRQILAQKAAIAKLEVQKSARDDESQAIFDDQQRLRENIKALKGTPEEKPLLQRYTGQLNDQETRLEGLKKETDALDAQIEAAKASLDGMIQQLSFDVVL